MTPTDRRLYEYIEGFTRANGYSPTLREMMAGLGLSSTSVVTYHLYRMRDRGLVTFVDGKTRTVRIVEAA